MEGAKPMMAQIQSYILPALCAIADGNGVEPAQQHHPSFFPEAHAGDTAQERWCV